MHPRLSGHFQSACDRQHYMQGLLGSVLTENAGLVDHPPVVHGARDVTVFASTDGQLKEATRRFPLAGPIAPASSHARSFETAQARISLVNVGPPSQGGCVSGQVKGWVSCLCGLVSLAVTFWGC